MSRRAEMRACLISRDVDQFRAINAEVFPHFPQPATREAAEMAMHHATTQTASLPLRARAWSHRWLAERNLPSGLPDELKPRAERLYPRVVDGVGISVNTSSSLLRPAMAHLQHAMEGAVLELHGDGVDLNLPIVTQRMNDARAREAKALFGEIDLRRVAAATPTD